MPSEMSFDPGCNTPLHAPTCRYMPLHAHTCYYMHLLASTYPLHSSTGPHMPLSKTPPPRRAPLPLHLSISMSMSMSDCLSMCLSICPSVRLSVHFSVYAHPDLSRHFSRAAREETGGSTRRLAQVWAEGSASSSP